MQEKIKIKLKTKPNKLMVFALVFVILFQTGLFLYFYLDKKDQNNNEENISLLDELSDMILLPNDNPQIYEINNINEVKETYGKFFDNAADGDKLILYSDRAIIFREKDNLIINVGPVLQITNSSKGALE